MAKDNSITEESFDALLQWLDRNPENAAQKYEKIRQRLIRFFYGRACFEAENLADETFNRVALKLPQLAADYTGGEPARYFYGVADKVHLEWLRKQKKARQLQLPEKDEYDETGGLEEIQYDCLESCLSQLPAELHRLVVEYYREEKTARIENRRRLAEKFEISVNTLQVKMSRLRGGLKKCVRKCLAEKADVQGFASFNHNLMEQEKKENG